MYDLYVQKTNYPFKGKLFKEYRYFQEDTTLTIKGQTFTYKKGDKNPFFKKNPDIFMFNITDEKTIDKRQPLGNMLVKVRQISIKTRFVSENFVQGKYIEYNGAMWIIKASEVVMGPQKSIYSYFNINPLATTQMILEEAQE